MTQSSPWTSAPGKTSKSPLSLKFRRRHPSIMIFFLSILFTRVKLRDSGIHLNCFIWNSDKIYNKPATHFCDFYQTFPTQITFRINDWFKCVLFSRYLSNSHLFPQWEVLTKHSDLSGLRWISIAYIKKSHMGDHFLPLSLLVSWRFLSSLICLFV